MTLRLCLASLASMIVLASCRNPPPDGLYPPPNPILGDGGYGPEAPPIQTNDIGQDPSATDPQAPTPPSTPPSTRGDYPVATRTSNPNQVISPYEPFERIDITGFRSGQLARDPSNKKIFRIP